MTEPECTCAMTEASFRACPVHGEDAPDPDQCICKTTEDDAWFCPQHGHVGYVADAPDPEEGVKEDPQVKTTIQMLTDWWIEKAQDEVAAVAPKAVEYSAVDLMEYGRTLALVMDRGPISDEEATEIGIWGYLVGKVARWTGAIKEGRRVSDDTVHDCAVYVKMAQRNRDVGGWPYAREEGH